MTAAIPRMPSSPTTLPSRRVGAGATSGASPRPSAAESPECRPSPFPNDAGGLGSGNDSIMSPVSIQPGLHCTPYRTRGPRDIHIRSPQIPASGWHHGACVRARPEFTEHRERRPRWRRLLGIVRWRTARVGLCSPTISHSPSPIKDGRLAALPQHRNDRGVGCSCVGFLAQDSWENASGFAGQTTVRPLTFTNRQLRSRVCPAVAARESGFLAILGSSCHRCDD